MGDPERPDGLRPLPGRLQHQRDHARGQGRSGSSRATTPRSTGLALRQGPLRVPAPLRRRPDRRAALPRAARGFERGLLGGRARRGRAAAARGGDAHRDRAVRLRDGRAGVRARSAAAPRPRGARGRAARGSSATPSTRSGAAVGDRAKPSSSSFSATSPSSSARRSSTFGSRAARGAAARTSCPELRRRRSGGCASAERAILIWSDGAGRRLAAALARARPRRRLRRFYLPRRRTAAASPTPGPPRPTTASPGRRAARAARHLRRRGRRRPDVRALAERGRRVLAIAMFRALARGWADLVLPGNELSRARRHVRQPRGPPPAPAPRGDPAVPDELAWIASSASASASRSRRTRRSSSTSSRRVFYGGISFGDDRRAGAALPQRAAAPSRRGRARARPRRRRGGSPPRSRYRPLFSGPPSSVCPELQFQRPAAEFELSRGRRSRARHRTGDAVEVRGNDTSARLRARLSADARQRDRRARRATTPRAPATTSRW